MSQGPVPGDSGKADLCGSTGVFNALAESHEQIVEEHDATEAEAQLKELASRNGQHDAEFQQKLAKLDGAKKKGSFQRLVRNLRRMSERGGDQQKVAG